MNEVEQNAKNIVSLAEEIIEGTGGKELIDDIDNDNARVFIHMLMLISVSFKLIDIFAKEV